MNSVVSGVTARSAWEEKLPQDYVVAQHWDAYGDEEHGAWRQVLARNSWMLDTWGDRVHPEYVAGLAALSLPDRIPRVEDINERLEPTGWRVVCVDGYVPTSAYVALMASSVFPMSRRIRRLHHVDYSPEPDLAHDVIGHLPMLFSREHREFLQRLATVMSRARSNGLDDALYAANRCLGALKTRGPASLAELRTAAERVERIHRALRGGASELAELGRMYLWSVEFGLMGTTSEVSVAGAALFSATLEMESIALGRAALRPYSIDVVNVDIDFTDLQSTYFVAHDFAHLHDVLGQYELRMNAKTRGCGDA
jgi:phenylalanine-4-hydroxylase